MKGPIRSLLLFNLDLSGDFFFFFNDYRTKDICCEDGREEEFSEEQNIPETGSGGFQNGPDCRGMEWKQGGPFVGSR